MAKLDFPATTRNRSHILKVMQRWLATHPRHDAATCRVLEIAAGSGQHSAHFAPALAKQYANFRWQSTDLSPEHLSSIEAWQSELGMPIFGEPTRLDVLEPVPDAVAKQAPFDLVYCANMIHIAPWACTDGLLTLAAKVLQPQGKLMLYGPFMREGQHTAPSNAAFHEQLREQDPAWGVRELEAVEQVAADHGFRRCDLEPMPANNFSVLFTRS